MSQQVAVQPQDHRIEAPDGRRLAATTFPGTTGDVVVVAPATGVKRTFYAGFAAAVAERGPTVVTFDYRGIGGSRDGHPRRETATVRQWAELDIEAALRHARRRAEARVLWVGQSAGAVYLPLAASRRVPERILSVSGMSGYWRLMTPSWRWRLGLGWYVGFPLVSTVLGYAPRWLWGGEDLPRGVMREWGRWCRHPDYFGAQGVGEGYGEITAPILAVRAADDPWATEAASEAINQRFTAALVERRIVAPAEVGAERIGHIHLLRRSVGGPIWPELIDWLLA